MKRALLLMAAIAVLLGVSSAVFAQATPAAETKTTAIVALSSVGELKKDIDYLGKTMGIEGLAAGLAITDESIDPSKPLGLVTQVMGKDKFRQIAFVPVKDFQALMKMITAPLADMDECKLEVPDDAENGTWKIEVPLPTGVASVFARKQGGWAVFTNDSSAFAQLPADPASLLGGLNTKYDFAARASLDNIPKARRQQAIKQLEMFAQVMALQMGEDAAVARAAISRMVKEITDTTDQLADVLVGLTIDVEAGAIVLDLAATAVEGTNMADQFAQVTTSKTDFAGFDLPGAAVTGNLVSALTDADVKEASENIKQARSTALAELRNQGLSDDELELATDLLNDILDVVQKTIEAKKFDGGMVVMLDAGKATIAGGAAITEGAKLEKVIKQLAGIVAEEDKDLAKSLKLDAETHEGVRFHVFSTPAPDPELAKLIGKTLTVALGIGDKSVYAGAGTDPVGLLKQVIDASKSRANEEIPPARLSVALAPIVKMAAGVADAGPPKRMADALAKALQESPGKDRLMITTNPIPKGSLIRVKLEEGVLKAIGAAVQVGGSSGEIPIPGFAPAPGGPPGVDPF